MTPAGRAPVRSWLIWLTAVTVYLLAVFHRTSFGVAGLKAAERFGVGSAALGIFTVLQVGVYAAMQIPTGVLVDRYGPRRVLTAAVLILGSGQLLLGLADTYALGLVARGVLGLGDALTFVSVLRLVAAHFPAHRYALLASFTSCVGYLGNLAATVPLTLLLDGPGWTVTFLAVGAVTVLYSVPVALRVRDTPGGVPEREREPVRPAELARQVKLAWRTPGTRLGFWVHFSTMFAPNVLTLLWGMPFLVQGEGLPAATASALLTVFVFGSMAGGPLLGAVIGRAPALRVPLVIGYLAGAAIVWAVLLGWNGHVPVGVLVPAFGFLTLGGPASMIGFAIARDYNRLSRVGTATGVVNVGGFLATTVTALLIGILLQATGGNFRIALLVVVAVLAAGASRMLVWWRRARAHVFAAAARGEEVPVRIRRHRWDRAPEEAVAA
ncbi:MFS transporter [Amycolatopsis rubida]|uniref:MFS transporter n=1 Tax=Amycolatopsis rubida TaxID=112413 RepID=A0ABX0BNF2_9PSEU|nr:MULTISPECIES: MFS transporter [Amycolatopsis]MYW91453.1 MFS transporter [Amycolatopsis rubida]NEC56438.1 MFS transporter [Amycolatopsis rubida]OAP21954.1 putative galactarate transporter [Amycolatopsis sp. M39]